MTEANPSPPRSADSYWLTRFVMLRLARLRLCRGIPGRGETNPAADRVSRTPAGGFISRAGSEHAGFAGGRVSCGCHRCSGSLIRTPSCNWRRGSASPLACVVVAGYANAIVMAALWALYMSFVHVGPGLVWLRVGNPTAGNRDSWRFFFARCSMAGRFRNARRRRWCSGCFAGSFFASCSARR